MQLNHKRKWLAAGGLLLVGLAVRVWLGIVYPSVYWADEIFQSFEQAHRVVFGLGIVPWEYEVGLRSWVFPGLLAAVMWLGEPLGPGSWGYLSLATVVLSAVSLIPAVVAWRWAEREFGSGGGRDVGAGAGGKSEGKTDWWPLLAMVVPLVWFEVIYFAPKGFYESFTAHVVIGGIFLVRFAGDRWFRAVLGGAIIGLCIIARPHLAPVALTLGLAVPLFAERPHHRFSGLVVGVVAGAGVAGTIDMFVWGAPFQSLFVNIYENVIQEKASQWGTAPASQYIWWLWEVSPTGSLMMAGGLLVGVIRYPTLAWPAVAILLAHSAIPHKEYRFIYPANLLAWTIAGIEMARFGRWASGKVREASPSPVAKLVGPAVALSLAGAVTAASVYDGLRFDMRRTGEEGETLNWQLERGKLLAYRYLSTREDVCGVARVGMGWGETGGYAWLHRDIPVKQVKNLGVFQRYRPQLDAFVVQYWNKERFETYEQVKCWERTCVYVRPGGCSGD